MDKLTSISVTEFSKFQVDTKSEQVLVPEGYELYKKESPIERVQKEILRLQEELKRMKQPDDKELIELGRMHHPYHEIISIINDLKNANYIIRK